MSRNKNPTPKSRLNLELNVTLKQKIEELITITEAASLSEVIRNAILVYDFLLKEKSLGNKLLIKNDKSSREIEIL